MKIDLTAETPITYAACAYRDYRAGIITRDAAALIIRHHGGIPLADDAVAAVLDAEPGSDALARALCDRDGWDHHDQTDDHPCTRCKADAEVLSAAASG